MSKLGAFGVADRAAADQAPCDDCKHGRHTDPCAAAGCECATSLDVVEFCGQDFRVAESFGSLSIGKWLASLGSQMTPGESLVLTFQLLQSVVHTDDWPGFEQLAVRRRASLGDLLPLVFACIAPETDRPTEPSSDSSAGRSTTTVSSEEPSPSQESSPPQRRPGDILSDPRMEGMQTVDELIADIEAEQKTASAS